jgi:hypothetical protein
VDLLDGSGEDESADTLTALDKSPTVDTGFRGSHRAVTHSKVRNSLTAI